MRRAVLGVKQESEKRFLWSIAVSGKPLSFLCHLNLPSEMHCGSITSVTIDG